MSLSRYKLPTEVAHLVHARNQLRKRYEKYGLNFTPDGNLVGDLGEAIAAELFGLSLAEKRGTKAIDAFTRERETVQIKASGRGQSIQFTHSEEPAVWLLVLVLDYEREEVEVAYNGPYLPAVSKLPSGWFGQRPVTVTFLRKLNSEVPDDRRLKAIGQ